MSARMFETRSQEFDRHVLIPDIHGEHRVVQHILDLYEASDDIGFVFLGDVIDRQIQIPGKDSELGVYRTIDIIRSLGSRAVLCMANHEHMALGGMPSVNKHTSISFAKGWLGVGSDRHMETNTFYSYGMDIDLDKVTETEAPSYISELEKRMAAAGHLTVLTSAAPYYETDKFIAVHAGVHPTSDWEEQKYWLEQAASNMADGNFFERPEQWWSMMFAKDARPIRSTDKIVVSGHAHTVAHYRLDPPGIAYSDQRILNGGQRIRLGSYLNGGHDAYIWQDWDGEVIQLSQKDM